MKIQIKLLILTKCFLKKVSVRFKRSSVLNKFLLDIYS